MIYFKTITDHEISAKPMSNVFSKFEGTSPFPFLDPQGRKLHVVLDNCVTLLTVHQFTGITSSLSSGSCVLKLVLTSV